MRATRKIFCHLDSFSSRDDKNLEGGSHIHIPLRFFEITGLFRDQKHKKTCYKPSSQSLTKASIVLLFQSHAEIKGKMTSSRNNLFIALMIITHLNQHCSRRYQHIWIFQYTGFQHFFQILPIQLEVTSLIGKILQICHCDFTKLIYSKSE